MGAKRQNKKIVIQITRNYKRIKVSLPKLKNLVKTVCRRFKLSEAIVSISIVSDFEIRKINRNFLNRDCITDCISFDLSDTKSITKYTAKLFEVVVNGEMAVRQGKLRGHSGEAELALYITHGLLHNLGFDDLTGGQAKKMHNEEDKILQQLGYGVVYNKHTKVQRRR
jgi:probable rRNA maturation factor